MSLETVWEGANQRELPFKAAEVRYGLTSSANVTVILYVLGA